MAGDSDSGAERELRTAEKFPRLTSDPVSWPTFARGFTRWYADHFGYRSHLLRQNNFLKWIGMGTSPSEDVVCGRDDWVFYRGNDSLDQTLGRRPFDEAQIESWLEMLEERRAWLAERGCEYLFVVAPSKASVYPEFLPAGYSPVGPNRVDQLFGALKERSEVHCLDLRAAMVDERSNDTGGDWTYYPLGTHWTWRGALRGWREIVAALPELFDAGPPELASLNRTLLPEDQGDSWGTRLYLEEHLRQEVWAMRVPEPREPALLGYGWHGTRYGFPEEFEGPRVMLFHDSFGKALKGFLARSCAPLTCFWTSAWEPAWIAAERPELVVDLFVERTLMSWRPAAMGLETQATMRAEFDEASTAVWEIRPDEPADVWEVRSERLHARGATVADGVEIRGFAPRKSKGVVRLPDLEGDAGDLCLVALDVERPEGGLLHIKVGGQGRGKEDVSWAYAEPGRQRLYFSLRLPARSREIWLRTRRTGWTLYGAEARNSGVRE